MDFFHRFTWVAAVDVNDGLAMCEPAQIPVGKGVAVACDEKRARACHLEHGPVDKAVVRTDQKERAGFGHVLDAVDFDSVAEHERECETQSSAQKRHRGALEREYEREG